jgi:hypothetical protein
MKKQLRMSSEVAFSFKKIHFNQKGRAGAGKLPLPIIAREQMCDLFRTR